MQIASSLRLQWHEYRCEDLIAEREATLAGVLDFIAVKWHGKTDGHRDLAASGEVITPSNRGVTEPIYHEAVGRWRAYKGHLAPALDRPAPFVAAFGYDA